MHDKEWIIERLQEASEWMTPECFMAYGLGLFNGGIAQIIATADLMKGRVYTLTCNNCGKDTKDCRLRLDSSTRKPTIVALCSDCLKMKR